MLPYAFVDRSEQDTQRRSAAERVNEMQKDGGAVDHDAPRRLRYRDSPLIDGTPHDDPPLRMYMISGEEACRLLSKNNYF